MTTPIHINKDVERDDATVQYLTGPAEAMMEHMVGRKKIKGVWAILPGFELAIQPLDMIRDTVPEHSPDHRSALEIIRDNFGNKFDLYLTVPNPDGAEEAVVWYLTESEFDLAHEWELIEQGMQEDIRVLTITRDGNFRAAIVNGLQTPVFMEREPVYMKHYSPYIAPVDKMHFTAKESRERFVRRRSGKSAK